MALSATGRPRGLISFLQIIMTTFAALMESVFHRGFLSFSRSLVALLAKFACGLAFLPGVVALQTVDLIVIDMFLVSEGHLSVRNIVGDHLFCKSAADHEQGKNKPGQYPDAD